MVRLWPSTVATTVPDPVIVGAVERSTGRRDKRPPKRSPDCPAGAVVLVRRIAKHPRVAVWVVKLIVVLAEAVAGPATTSERIILPGNMQVVTTRDRELLIVSRCPHRENGG